MKILRHTHTKDSIARKTIVFLVVAITLTSIKIQTASAMELLPSAPTFSTATQMVYDAIQQRGFTLMESGQSHVEQDGADTVKNQEPAMSVDQNQSREADNVKYTKVYTVTAYNSVPWQTDSTPCISADGSNICKLRDQGDHSCAAALPFGTKINVPGFGVCTVRDRLAPRFSYRIDLYFGGSDQIQAAKQWGKRHVEVAVLDSIK